MIILYVGAKTGTSGQRAAALLRCGYQVDLCDPYEGLPRSWRVWLYRTGGLGLDARVASALAHCRGGYDLCLVDCGDVIGPKGLGILRTKGARTALYCADNPFDPRRPEQLRWRLLRRAVPGYDVVATIARPGIEAAMVRLGVRQARAVFHCADEISHWGRPARAAEKSCDLVFAGTYMPGRDAFCAALVAQGIDLRIIGPRWRRAPRFSSLKHRVEDRYLDASAYRDAIASARLALVLLNGANGDLHTSRSAEIPAIGTAMLAPDTDHHRMLYGAEDAALFSDAGDCARQALDLLADDKRLDALARRGQARARANGAFNEKLMRQVVNWATERDVGRAEAAA